MSKYTAIVVGVSYPIVVILSVLLLAAVQQRSSSGIAFDTWRLNYKSNIVASQTFDERLVFLRAKGDKASDDAAFTDGCLKLYNNDGTYNSAIDQDLVNKAKIALGQGKKSDDFDGEMRCLLRGYLNLIYDKKYFDAQAENYGKETLNLEVKISANNERLDNLIKGHDEFLALIQLEKFSPLYSYLAVSTPYNLLILLLTMFMGPWVAWSEFCETMVMPHAQIPRQVITFFTLKWIGGRNRRIHLCSNGITAFVIREGRSLPQPIHGRVSGHNFRFAGQRHDRRDRAVWRYNRQPKTTSHCPIVSTRKR